MRKKIRLDLSDLRVESFVASEGMTLKGGTVFGMANTVGEGTCNEVTHTCNDAGGPGGCQSIVNANCNWTTDENAESCTAGYWTGGTGNPSFDPCTGYTCPETPASCDAGPCNPE